MSDEQGHSEERPIDTFEPVPDSYDPYAHIPTVVAIGSRFALDPLVNELPKQGYRTVVTTDPAHVTQEAGQIDVVIATDEATTHWDGTKALSARHGCPLLLLTMKREINPEKAFDANLSLPAQSKPSTLASAARSMLALRVRMSEISTLERFMQESLPKRHIAPQFMHRFTSGELTLDAPAHQAKVCILQVKIWDFENLALTLEPDQISGLLNEFFSVMTEVIFDHGGTLDKFTGDGLLGFFGAPVSFEEEEMHARSIDCALAMRRALQGFNVLWEMENLPQIRMQIGVHCGDVIVGSFGTLARNDYGILGKNVDITRQIEKRCDPDEILVSQTLTSKIERPFTPRGKLEFPGQDPLPLFSVAE